MGLFNRLKEGLMKTREGFVSKITELVTGQGEIDEDFFERLEEILITADVGVNTSMKLVSRVRQKVKEGKIREAARMKDVVRQEIANLMEQPAKGLDIKAPFPWVILVVGVNGVGKTTTIGKLAHKVKSQGFSIVVAAGDTFRAAAIEQLEIWGNRAGVLVVKHQAGADPAAVAYDAVQAAKSRGYQVVIIDTAGRLQTKTNLMEEVKKVRRVVEREIAGGPQEVLLVLDATTGQNALSQAKLFTQSVGVTGLVLTKLDGTAKGGVVIGIASELELPVKLIGFGEGIEDLKDFNPQEFVDALFDEN
ncbi:MAG: signal recognition particle-docking protein FtsY [Bacillota bacterium]